MADKYSEPKTDLNNFDKDLCSRNPITGMGLNGDGVGGLKPKIAKSRGEIVLNSDYMSWYMYIYIYICVSLHTAGNPVTGEGYSAGLTDLDFMRKISRRPGPMSH